MGGAVISLPSLYLLQLIQNKLDDFYIVTVMPGKKKKKQMARNLQLCDFHDLCHLGS